MTQRAFSLVEMVIALALSAFLMTSLLIVSTSMARTERTLNLQQVSHDPMIEIIGLLRRDLSQAHSIKQVDDTVELKLVGGLDEQTGEPTHRLMVVSYEVQVMGDIRYLIRRQTDLTKLSNHRESINLVLPHVQKINVETLRSPTAGDQSDSNDSARGTSKPNRVRLSIRSTDEARPEFTREFLLE